MPELTDEERGRKLAALREELRGYETRGLDDRAKEVEKEMARLGGDTPVKRAERRPAAKGEQRA